jgi:formylglycine-generating enzyme required for sulfatase activity
MTMILCALALGGAALPFLSHAAPPQGEKYALLVGVREYDKNELRNLPYTEADVEALADVLRKAGYQRVVLMTQTEGAKQSRFLPLAANIRKSLKGILQDRTENDSVLIAFAGHGVQYQDEAENYFCPMDAKLTDKKSLISLTEVYKDLEKSEAGTRLLFVDACRNDPRSDPSLAVDRIKLESVTRPQRALPPGGVAAFFSCSAGEKAYENSELKHGVFFHFVIEGLKGKAADEKGKVDLDDLVRYTKRRVTDFVKEQYGDDVRQMPELIGKTRGLVSLVNIDSGDKPDATITEEKGKDEITNTIGMKLKRIKAGKFLMGSPKDEEGRYDGEGPQHQVEITKAFYMGVYPVTRGQFAAFAKDADYTTEAEIEGTGYGYDFLKKKFESGKYTWRKLGFKQTDDHPVVEVTWNDATAFCAWLSKKEGKHYELPTEAQWEYACRAGTKTRFWCGDEDASLKGNENIADASFKEKYPKGDWAVSWDDGYAFTSPVGSFKANPWGLYDMHGNVWQWCADYYDAKYYENSDKKDPFNSSKSDARVLRGGSWDGPPQYCRAASRYWFAPGNRNDSLGFRVAVRLD